MSTIKRFFVATVSLALVGSGTVFASVQPVAVVEDAAFVFTIDEQDLHRLVAEINAQAPSVAWNDIPAFSALDAADAVELAAVDLDAIRGEVWTLGLYVKGVVEAGVAGVRVGSSTSYKYNITDKSGKVVTSLTLKLPTMKVMNGNANLGAALSGEKVLASFGLKFGSGLVGEIGIEIGKNLSQVNKYFLEFLAGGGVGAAVGATFKVNNVSFAPGAGASATAGAWIRSTGSVTQILKDIITAPVSVPLTIVTAIKKY